MNKTQALKLVNILLALSVFFQIISGMIISEFRASFLYSFHDANGWIVLLLSLLHVAYNWNWVKANFSPTKKAL